MEIKTPREDYAYNIWKEYIQYVAKNKRQTGDLRHSDGQTVAQKRTEDRERTDRVKEMAAKLLAEYHELTNSLEETREEQLPKTDERPSDLEKEEQEEKQEQLTRVCESIECISVSLDRVERQLDLISHRLDRLELRGAGAAPCYPMRHTILPSAPYRPNVSYNPYMASGHNYPNKPTDTASKATGQFGSIPCHPTEKYTGAKWPSDEKPEDKKPAQTTTTTTTDATDHLPQINSRPQQPSNITQDSKTDGLSHHYHRRMAIAKNNPYVYEYKGVD